MYYVFRTCQPSAPKAQWTAAWASCFVTRTHPHKDKCSQKLKHRGWLLPPLSYLRADLQSISTLSWMSPSQIQCLVGIDHPHATNIPSSCAQKSSTVPGPHHAPPGIFPAFALLHVIWLALQQWQVTTRVPCCITGQVPT